MDTDFFKGKRVLLTGHTGFKGSWMCRLLLLLGAEVTGYSLSPSCEGTSGTEPLFGLCGVQERIRSVIGDIRDLKLLQDTFTQAQPEIVIHMAAQPLVRYSYQEPVYTYDVNVMGTVNILECVRTSKSVRSFVNVTTDKVYRNREWVWGYRENEELNGYDPYSNSKSCSELVTESYRKSFFADRAVSISTVRAGNVIGGGDFAEDRIIPDCVRAAYGNRKITVRNPGSVRPYEHVLEPLTAYLMVACAQYGNPDAASCYNVGPDEEDCITTGELVSLFCASWKKLNREDLIWTGGSVQGPHEANYLKLDCSKVKRKIGWKPKWNIDTAVEKTAEWYTTYKKNEDVAKCMDAQIEAYLNRGERG